MKQLVVMVISVMLAVVVMVGPVGAERLGGVGRQGAEPVGGDISDPAEVGAFMDGLVSGLVSAHNVPGATVAVVHDGEVVLVRGYGDADIEAGKPVDGETTLFRPGSISKTVVAIAVMQLVEEGVLDLDTDINTYLDEGFSVTPLGSDPITLRHLLTHTAGFEDLSEGLFVDTPERMITLADFVKRYQPEMLYAPGVYSGYSNYGLSLAGYIVQLASGEPFVEYLTTHIFAPLEMDTATFEQPLPERLLPTMAMGYNNVGGENVPRFFEIVNGSPAGAMTASSGDMARYMLALLNGGELDGARILEEATLAEMWDVQFSPHPQSRGIGLIFWRQMANGQLIISHEGDTIFFHSGLYLLPESGTGLYVSTNGPTGVLLRDDLLWAVLDHFYPAELVVPNPSVESATLEPLDLREYAGGYVLTRRNETTPEKVSGLVQPPSIAVVGERELAFVYATLSETFTYVAPDKFVSVDNPDAYLLFERDAAGGVQAAYLSDTTPFALIKRQWYEDPTLHLPVAGVALLLFVTALIAAPFSFFVDRRIELEVPLAGRAARWLAIAVCALFVGTVIALVVAFTDFESIVFGPPAWFPVVYQLPRVGALLTVVMAVLAVLAWVRGWWGWVGRLHYSVLTVAAVLFTAIAWYWKLLV